MAISILMLVSNSERDKEDMRSEIVQLTAETERLTEQENHLRNERAKMLVQLSELRTEKLTMAASLAGYSKREMMLERTVSDLRDELAVAREEAKILVANFRKTSTEMQTFVSRTDEQAYNVLRENNELKSSARQRDAQMLDLLAEVSSLNTEIALLKDEREEMNREIGKLTAALQTLSVKDEPRRVSLR